MVPARPGAGPAARRRRVVVALLGLAVLAPSVTASSAALTGAAADRARGGASAAAWAAHGIPVLSGRDVVALAAAPAAQPRDVPVAVPLAVVPLPGGTGGAAVVPGAVGTLGVPQVAIDAYQAAAARLAADQPGCGISWTLLAGVGRIESGHARGGRVDANGTTVGRIIGPVLDGSGPNAAIVDTEDGRLDGDTVWDRAVGPMQFLPGTWARWGADGSGDGVADPHNLTDAALGSGRYLCSGGVDLRDPAQLRAAVFRYNRSTAYVDEVLAWAAAYATGVVPTESASGPVPSSAPAPTRPADPAPAPSPSAPADPAPPLSPPGEASPEPPPASSDPVPTPPGDPAPSDPTTPAPVDPTTPAG